MPPGWTPQDWEPRNIDLLTLGVPVRLRCWGDDPDALAQRVRRAWSAALGATAPGRDAGAVLDVVVTADEAVSRAATEAGAVADASIDMVLHVLSSRVTLSAMEQQAGRLWMLHGAGLADPTSGATVALVGPSGTGKSTASRALGRRFGYVTDETTAIGSDLRIHPHPKPLSIIRPGSGIKDQIAPGDAGLLPSPPAPWLAGLLVLRRDGTREVSVERLRTSVAIALLAPETSFLAHFDRPLALLAEIIEQTAGVFEVHYEEAADLEPVVAGLVGE